MKKVLSMILAITLLFSCLQPSVFAQENRTGINTGTVTIENTYADAGGTVEVDVVIADNPGIAGATFSLSYDKHLTLIDAVSGDAFSNLEFSGNDVDIYANPCKFSWDSENEEATKDGVILKLTFAVSEQAKMNTNLGISISYRDGDVYNEEADLELNLVNGYVMVIDYLPGDVFEDGVINTKDVRIIRQLINGNCSIEVKEEAADVNADNVVNTKDTRLLRRYINGGYGVVLLPSVPKCSHVMKATAAKSATCTTDGNIAYWYCTECKKYFSNENGTTEITVADTIIKAKGHTDVEIPAVAPGYDVNGWTAGVKCSVCGKILVEPEYIEPLQPLQVHVTYELADSDTYLANYISKQQAAGKTINPNPAIIDTSKADTTFKKIENGTIPGYEFQGWFVDTVDGATKVDKIQKGATGSLKLYAKWVKKEFTVTYASDMDPVTDEKYMKYYTDKGLETLPSQHMDKYVFVGWTDKEGNIWKSIPAGTATDLTLYANWASTRNRAVAVDKLGEPLIVEDSDNGLMLFTYEIGTIENVPLFTTLRLQCVNGLISTVETTKENMISSEQAKTVAETISNATTNSASWTLESNWNNTTEVSKKYLEETSQTREEAESIAKSQSNTYNVGSSYSESEVSIDTSSGSYKFSGNQAHSDSTTKETGQDFNLSVDAKYSNETSVGVEVGLPIKGLEAGITAGNTSTFEIGGGIDYGNYAKNTNSGTDSWSNSLEGAKESSNSKTTEKNWNTSEGYSNSNSVSVSNQVSTAISKLISEEYGYGKSYAEGGSNSEAREQASTESKSNEFSSTITYYSSEINSTTTSFSSTGNTVGDYRMVMAGTVHVFAVVGYDVATSSYFVYTYNVLDEKTEEYLDYSYDGSFNDYETGIIPFEVPSFVNDYVNNRIAETAGLTFNTNTGVYVRYTEPEKNVPTIISVPSYYANDNGDGTYDCIKVTGISSTLFQNNKNIVGVILGRHITEIPDNAFKGCTSLKYVICPGVTKIGANAFSGCTSLEKFTISTDITSVGTNAFTNVPEIMATVSTAEIAERIASSGADKITLDISMIPGNEAEGLTLHVGTIDTFELWGKKKEYKELSLQSDAKTTIINGVKIINATQIPLTLSSEKVILNNETSVKAFGYAMLLTADMTNIVLNGTIRLSADSGNTVIYKSIKLAPLSTSVVGEMIVSGKVLICGSITGKEYLTSDGIQYIDEATYEQYKKGMFEITFDPNGGTVSETTRTVVLGQALGTLPVPTKDYHTFLGWYTAKTGGDKVTAETMLANAQNLIVYAQWKENTLSGWVKASEVPSGAQIVNRKWSYTLREYTSSANDSLSGYTLYNKEVTQWGPTQGAVYYDPSNGVRKVWSETYETGRTHYYHYYRYVNSSGSKGSDKQTGPYITYEAVDLTYKLTEKGSMGNYAQGYRWYYNGSNYRTMWLEYEWDDIQYGTRWYYQDPIYTYYFYRDVAKEAASNPTGQSNVSNVVEWVQYRGK